MKSLPEQVAEFNLKILGIDLPKQIGELSYADFTLLMKQLDEELVELKTAWEDATVTGQVDAIIDLIYFALGGLHKMGLRTNQVEHVFGLVHEANMTKGLGKVAKRHVEGALDAVKPADFVAPELAIREYLNV